MFVLITEILDTFGRLVYGRILEKATYIRPGTSIAVPLPGKAAGHARDVSRVKGGVATEWTARRQRHVLLTKRPTSPRPQSPFSCVTLQPTSRRTW